MWNKQWFSLLVSVLLFFSIINPTYALFANHEQIIIAVDKAPAYSKPEANSKYLVGTYQYGAPIKDIGGTSGWNTILVGNQKVFVSKNHTVVMTRLKDPVILNVEAEKGYTFYTPSATGESLGSLPKNTQIAAIGVSGNFYFFLSKEGQSSIRWGFISKTVVKVIPAPQKAPQTITPAPALKDPPILVSPDGTFLGTLTTNQYDSDSIFNKYGDYGSKYSSESIFNEYGDYGSKYSDKSPFNKYADEPPLIIYRNKVIGVLTINDHERGAISPYLLSKWLSDNGF